MEAERGVTVDGPAAGARALRVLTFTSLYPSQVRHRHGIFVETRLQHLLRECNVDARVIAPVPWFPLASPVFGQYARFAATPRRATRDNGLQVSYPRYLMLPKVGVAVQPDNMARAAIRDAMALKRSGWHPDLIDAHYFYPDGVAAAILAERLQIPFVITARGTDVNVLGRTPGPARRILWAAQHAAAVIAVSSRLKDALVDIGVEASKIVVVRNGVDLQVFRPEPQDAARARLRLPGGKLIACVGNLVPEKGFGLAIESLRGLNDFKLVLVGEGPAQASLMQLARVIGVEDRVSFLPSMPQSELRHLYSSADVLMLTSEREGWPNVVLESLACGTPVVGVDVGAVGEMLGDRRVGRVVMSRDPALLAAAVHELLDAGVERDHVRRHAARFDWASVSQLQMTVFRRAQQRAQALQTLPAGCESPIR